MKQELALKSLYKKWPEFKNYLKKIGCIGPDAEDIFQEALVIYFRKIEDQTFELTVSPETYIKSICKFSWYALLRKKGRMKETDEMPEIPAGLSNEWLEKEEKLVLLEGIIGKIGKVCQDILHAFYTLGLNMEQIATKFKLRNDKVAKQQKYRCIQKVKDFVSGDSSNNELLNASL